MGTDSFSSPNRANSLFYWPESRWPLLSSPSFQAQKCDKCTARDKRPLEFFSAFNLRRHSRTHRKNAEKEEPKQQRRIDIAIFWDLLSCDEAAKILDLTETNVDVVSGKKTLDLFSRFPRHTSLFCPKQPYYRAAILIDALINKPENSAKIHSEELLKALDEASENTFLIGGPLELVVRHICQGDDMRILDDERNSAACLAFLLEANLLSAWNADKNVKAILSSNALVQEEEAAEKKRQREQQKKRQKKQRQKEKKGSPSDAPPAGGSSEGSDRSDQASLGGADDDAPGGDKPGVDKAPTTTNAAPGAQRPDGDGPPPPEKAPDDAEKLKSAVPDAPVTSPTPDDSGEKLTGNDKPSGIERWGDEEVGRWGDEVPDPARDNDGFTVKRSNRGPARKPQRPSFPKPSNNSNNIGGSSSRPVWTKKSKGGSVRDVGTDVGDKAETGQLPAVRPPSSERKPDEESPPSSDDHPPPSTEDDSSGDAVVFDQLFPHESPGVDAPPASGAPPAAEVPDDGNTIQVGTMIVPIRPPPSKSENSWVYFEKEAIEFLAKRWQEALSDPEAVVLSLPDDEEGAGNGGETPPEPGGGGASAPGASTSAPGASTSASGAGAAAAAAGDEDEAAGRGSSSREGGAAAGGSGSGRRRRSRSGGRDNNLPKKQA